MVAGNVASQRLFEKVGFKLEGTLREGFYLDAGWGTWGFKATPIAGSTMAHTVATGVSHPLISGFSLERFARLELTGEKGAASVGH